MLRSDILASFWIRICQKLILFHLGSCPTIWEKPFGVVLQLLLFWEKECLVFAIEKSNWPLILTIGQFDIQEYEKETGRNPWVKFYVTWSLKKSQSLLVGNITAYLKSGSVWELYLMSKICIRAIFGLRTFRFRRFGLVSSKFVSYITQEET